MANPFCVGAYYTKFCGRAGDGALSGTHRTAKIW
jgi:hypothetical protein